MPRRRSSRATSGGEIFRKNLVNLFAEDDDFIELETKGKEQQKQRDNKKGNKEREELIKYKKKHDDKKERHGIQKHDEGIEEKPKQQNAGKHKRNPNKENKVGSQPRDSHEAVVITEHRITKNLGIYNKSKISDTVFRGERKGNRKTLHDLQTRTDEDIAKVLDCSSFRLQPVPSLEGLVPENHAHHDTPGSRKSEHFARSIHSSEHSSLTLSAEYHHDYNKSNVHCKETLEFKTPLQEISENLLSSLKPAETFHGRNYLEEVRGELRKLHRQSLAAIEANNKSTNTGSSEIEERMAKMKSGEIRPPSVKRQRTATETTCTTTKTDDVLNALENICTHPKAHPENAPTDYAGDDNELGLLTRPVEAPDSSCKEKRKPHIIADNWDSLRTFDQNPLQQQPVSAPNPEGSTSAAPAFDLLELIDCTSKPVVSATKRAREQDEEEATWEVIVPDVSPQKKPWLDSPSPPKFYRRKLF